MLNYRNYSSVSAVQHIRTTITLRSIFIAIAMAILSGCGFISGQNSIIIPTLNEHDRKLMGTPVPLIESKLASIQFDLKSACLACGDYYTDYSRSHLTGYEMNSWLLNVYAAQLKEEISASGIFDLNASNSTFLTVKLTGLDHQYSLGRTADKNNPFTSGGSLLNTVKLRYELRNDLIKDPLASWDIVTYGSSNSTAPQHRMEEGMRFALLRNIQVFIIELKKALRPGLTDEEEKAYRGAKAQKVDRTRSNFGSAMMQTGRAINSVSDSVSSGTTAFFSALGSPEVQAHVRSSLNEMARTRTQMARQYNNTVNPYAKRTEETIGYYANLKESESSTTKENSQNIGGKEPVTSNNRLILSSSKANGPLEKAEPLPELQAYEDGGLGGEACTRAAERANKDFLAEHPTGLSLPPFACRVEIIPVEGFSIKNQIDSCSSAKGSVRSRAVARDQQVKLYGCGCDIRNASITELNGKPNWQGVICYLNYLIDERSSNTSNEKESPQGVSK